jgi:hypothetical protein
MVAGRHQTDMWLSGLKQRPAKRLGCQNLTKLLRTSVEIRISVEDSKIPMDLLRNVAANGVGFENLTSPFQYPSLHCGCRDLEGQ